MPGGAAAAQLPGKGRPSEQRSGPSQERQKDVCGRTKYQKDKVISKQVSENKSTGMKWEK